MISPRISSPSGKPEAPDDRAPSPCSEALALARRWRRSLPVRAEQLIVSVSNHRVTVTPNYSGEELVLFGSVEKDANHAGQPQLTIWW